MVLIDTPIYAQKQNNEKSAHEAANALGKAEKRG